MDLKRRNKEDNLYEQLQRDSIRMLQQLSGNVWTDFNEHDPGVTILDVLNFALLETKYRLDFRFEEYLCKPMQQKVDYPAIGLLPADILFAPVVLSPQDYEDLIKQQLPAIQNCRVTINPDHSYSIQIAIHEGFDFETVTQQVNALYHAHRNLCENLRDIQWMEPAKNTMRYRQPDDIRFHPADRDAAFSQRLQSPYHTVQHELPDCYGINKMGLPADASLQQRVSSLQLKSYMLIFDYMLSGVGQQTRNLHQLLNMHEHREFRFSTEIDVEELDRLLDKEKAADCDLIPEGGYAQHKKTYFDMLDALYGEDTQQPLLHNKKLARSELNQRRGLLIQQFPELNTNRFRSFNLLDQKNGSVAGIRRFASALAGVGIETDQPMSRVFSRHNLKLLSDRTFFDDDSWQVHFACDVDWLSELQKIPHQTREYNERKFTVLRQNLNFFQHHVLFEGFLEQGLHIENYRMCHVKTNETYILLYQHPGRTDRIVMGVFFTEERLLETLAYLQAFIGKLSRESSSLYVVEHNLLVCGDDENATDTSRLSLVIPRWTEQLYRAEDYETLLLERLPAHLATCFYRVDADELYRFEQIYFWWRRAWATDNKELIKLFSTKIRTELATNN